MSTDSAAEVMQKIQALVAEKGDGQLTIRISARRSPTAVVPTTLAVFGEGYLIHLSNIESWMPKLVGGGEYQVIVNHAADVGRRLVFTLILSGQPFSLLNVGALSIPDWQGPTNLLNAPAAQQQVEQPQAQPMTQFQFQPGVNPAAPRPYIAPQPAGAQVVAGMSATHGEQLLTVQREEARANAQLDKKIADLERREIEDRMRREQYEREQKMKSEFDAKLNSLTMALAAKPAPVEKPQVDLVAGLTALAGALAPVFSGIIASNNEMKRLQIEMQQKQAEMAAQNARELAAIAQRNEESRNAMLMKQLERPATSPEMAAMLDMSRFQAESQGQMMTQVINATGMVSKMSISMIETIAELNSPPEGSPVMDAVKETVKSLVTLVKGADTGARQSVAAAQQALPRGTQPPKQPAQPTPAQLEAARQRAAQVNATAAAQQQAVVQAQAPIVTPAPTPVPASVVVVPSTPPATVIPFPAQGLPPAPVVERVEVVVPEANAAFGDDMPDGFANIETKSSVDELKDLIRARHEPVDAVAAFFLDAIPTPEMRAALEAVEGDPSALLATHMGLEWLSDTENGAYVERLGESLERIGTERGAFEAEDADDSPSDEDPAPPAEAVVEAVKAGAP
ncbi:MAG: hypothetical protein WAV09_03415 [Minisyncoccia bacterium]